MQNRFILISLFLFGIVSPIFAQSSTDATSAFNGGIFALEKQNFRSAAHFFRTAYILDSANMTYLRHLAKALFHAEYNTLDSVRLAQQYLREYKERGGEQNLLWVEKANILTNDVNARVEALVQDSLRAAQKLANRYVSPYEYSYRATAQKPIEKVKAPESLAGKSVWTASLLLGAGLMQQPNTTFDRWIAGGLSIRAAFWGGLGETSDIGGDVGIRGTFGGLLESGSVPTRTDTGTALRRVYDGELTARLRFHFHSAGMLAFGATAHLENAQTLGFTPENAATSVLVGIPFHVLGAGLGWEPRDGGEGLIANGRYFFFPFLGTDTRARMITASVGYTFGRASMLVEGAFAQRSATASTLALQVVLHWHFIQAISEKREGE
jgi:hypothetical protein